MQVNQVAFGQKVLPKATTQKMQKLMVEMNSRTKCERKADVFSSKILGSLSSKEGIFFDSRYLASPINKISDGKANISMKKVFFSVDAKTGDILRLKKPFYMSCKRAFEKADSFIEKLQSNFDNKEVVKKGFINIGGFTENGAEKLNKALVKN